MRPLRLTMSAFGSYADEEIIDFSGIDHGLFLVTGDTGSGKTTIFDGIVYALYDRTSGGVRDGNMMRSAGAGLDTPTFVELVFVCRGEEYRVVRNPDYERASLRRGKNGQPGKTQEKSRAELYLPDGSLYRGNKRETNRKIEEIVGMDAGQFMQMAMIAQGDFLRLLHARSEERREIFSRIFDTGVYASLQEALRKQEKEDYAELREQELALREQMGRILFPEEEKYSPETAEEALDILGSLLEKGRREEARLFEEREETTGKAAEAVRLRETLESLREVRAQRKRQEDWLAENLPMEETYRERAQAAQKELEAGEEEFRRFRSELAVRTEKLESEYKEAQSRYAEIGALGEFWKMADQRGEAQEKAAARWRDRHAVYQEARRAYEEAYDAFFREQAGILARELQEGEACPVCGSTVHPRKAALSSRAPSQAQVAAARKQAAQAEEAREQAQLACQEASQARQAALGRLNQEGSRLLGDAFSAEEAGWHDRMLEEVEKARSTAEERREASEREKRAGEARRRELELRRETLRKTCRETEEALESFIRRTERIRGELGSLREREQALCGQWMKSGRSAGAPEGEAFEALLREVQSEAQRFQEENRRLESQYQAVHVRNETNRRTEQVLKTYQEEYERRKDRYVLSRHLSQTAGGSLSGSVRLDFESYVQRRYFERVIRRANQRLALMADGQFLLKCRSLEDLRGQGKVGLDLDVYSPVTESCRDVKTLSGGESFMAALCMALGLADVVGDAAGAIRLDTMFIDEGFGSLDDHAREQAIRVLQELAGENRVIGIISHVAELKEQMETKLEIRKGRKGSHAVWIR